MNQLLRQFPTQATDVNIFISTMRCVSQLLIALLYVVILWRYIFPVEVNEYFGGKPIALWIFWILATVSLWRSFVNMVKSDGRAKSRDPLKQLLPIAFMSAMMGISQLLIVLLYVVILWRYNSIFPLGCLLFIIECYLFTLLVTPIFEETSQTKNYVFTPFGILLTWYSRPGFD